MKKTILSIAMAIGFGTAQAGWISYDLDHVKADAKVLVIVKHIIFALVEV